MLDCATVCAGRSVEPLWLKCRNSHKEDGRQNEHDVRGEWVDWIVRLFTRILGDSGAKPSSFLAARTPVQCIRQSAGEYEENKIGREPTVHEAGGSYMPRAEREHSRRR